jgi:hypothetical protein
MLGIQHERPGTLQEIQKLGSESAVALRRKISIKPRNGKIVGSEDAITRTVLVSRKNSEPYSLG